MRPTVRSTRLPSRPHFLRRGVAVSRSEGLTDRVGQHDDPLRLDRSPTENSRARIARDAQDEIGGLDRHSLVSLRSWPRLDTVHLHDQLGFGAAGDQRS